jgi:hypothetical protein
MPVYGQFRSGLCPRLVYLLVYVWQFEHLDELGQCLPCHLSCLIRRVVAWLVVPVGAQSDQQVLELLEVDTRGSRCLFDHQQVLSLYNLRVNYFGNNATLK